MESHQTFFEEALGYFLGLGMRTNGPMDLEPTIGGLRPKADEFFFKAVRKS